MHYWFYICIEVLRITNRSICEESKDSHSCTMVWKTWTLRTGCVTGRPSAVTTQRVHSTIWPKLSSSERNGSHTPHVHWQTQLNAEMFPVIGITLVWPNLPRQRHSSGSTRLQILICASFSAVTQGGSLRKGMEKDKQGPSSCHTKTPPQKKVWQLFNFGKKSNRVGEEGGERSV